MGKPEKFPFRHDSGKVVWLDFDVMMTADACGFLTHKGNLYRRARDLEPSTVTSTERVGERTEIVSSSMGFIEESLGEMRDHLSETRIPGVEFVEDPEVPRFYDVHFSGEKAKQEYMKSRGLVEKNSRNGSGAMLTSLDFENAKIMVSRQHHTFEASQ